MLRALLVLALVLLTVGTPAVASAEQLPPSVQEQPIDVNGVSLDTTLYLPEVTPAPAVLIAHGFGGTKASVDADARELAERGYVALAWS
ncbi:MAG: dienelactone hydrolase family protein, partial [Pseudonocardia sp.]|nr:dienelactone hydrolase family protein [Pseudonocardia sp.]